MQKICVFLLFVLLNLGGMWRPLHAVQPSTDKDSPQNEFRYSGGTLVCYADTFDHSGYLPCLHMDDIYINMPIEHVHSTFRAPDTVITQSATKRFELYVFSPHAELLPYLAMTVQQDTVTALQMTGYENSHDVLQFNSLRLGDSATRVRTLLGEPTSRQPVEQVQSTRWSYSPFPISIEFKEDHIYSIKIWKP